MEECDDGFRDLPSLALTGCPCNAPQPIAKHDGDRQLLVSLAAY